MMEASVTLRIATERAILMSLIENLSAAGYKPAAVFTEEELIVADGQSIAQYRDAERPMTTEEVVKVFEEYDLYAPTVHFTHKNALSWGNRGVQVVPGNGVDFISDWHCSDDEFNAIVDKVAQASYDGKFAVSLTV